MDDRTFSDPVDCTVDFDTSVLQGKTAIVTGGVNGLGQAYVRALDSAGVAVWIADILDDQGKKLAAELRHAIFFHCDVTAWSDQLRLFQHAASHSPSGRVDFVVANAGIAPADDVFSYAGDDQEPAEPSLTTVDINLRGALYTTKLALHYFVKQNGSMASSEQQDTCLVLIGSGAAYFDVPRSPTYSATKWAMRGIMHGLRRTAYYSGTRVNMISPWYVRTHILSTSTFDHVKSSGVEFAETDDAAQCLLRILSDNTMNGRSLFVSARKWAAKGYIDLNLDGYAPDKALLQEIQTDQTRSAPVRAGLFI